MRILSLVPLQEWNCMIRKNSNLLIHCMTASCHARIKVSMGNCSFDRSVRSGCFDMIIDVQIIQAGIVPGKIVAHPVEHQFTEEMGIVLP